MIRETGSRMPRAPAAPRTGSQRFSTVLPAKKSSPPCDDKHGPV